MPISVNVVANSLPDIGFAGPSIEISPKSAVKLPSGCIGNGPPAKGIPTGVIPSSVRSG